MRNTFIKGVDTDSVSVHIISIVLNSILLIFELLSVSEVFLRYLPDSEPFPWYYTITYYTNISNIILLLGTVCSLILEVFKCKFVFAVFSLEFNFGNVLKYFAHFVTSYKKHFYTVSIH